MNIVGHTSRTGSEPFNDALSLQRARYIQQRLAAESAGLAGRAKPQRHGLSREHRRQRHRQRGRCARPPRRVQGRALRGRLNGCRPSAAPAAGRQLLARTSSIGHAGQHLLDAVLAQRAHAFGHARARRSSSTRAPVWTRWRSAARHGHQLVDAGAAAQAAAVALVAARRSGRCISRPRCRSAARQSASTSSARGAVGGAGHRVQVVVQQFLALRRRRRRAARGSALHSRRTSRCASTASSESAKLNGSMPMSSRRVTVSGALLVCSVLSTRWPVSDGLDRDLRGFAGRGSRRP